MAKKKRNSRWARDSRTEAKHRVLTGYLDAWIPIFGQQRSVQDLILIDGFAGPGRHTGGEKGSPLLMIDAYSTHHTRPQLNTTARFYFIEKDAARVADLEEEIAAVPPAADIKICVRKGDYAEHFPAVVNEVKSAWPKAPIFAFIDPFGADLHPALVGRLLELPRCEVLLFVPLGWFADFFKAKDMQRTLSAVFGEEVFGRCANQSPDQRRKTLVEMLEERLLRTCRWVRAFEIPPSGRGGHTHFLFFGTNNPTGLARMKSAMWNLDPIGGVRFMDSTQPDQAVLFEQKPDLSPLWDGLKEKFAARIFTVKEVEDFTLFDTPFLHNAHLKQGTLAPAERNGKLVPVDPPRGRRKNTYKSKSLQLRIV